MATNFPNSIQTFPTMLNMTAGDADIVTRYQEAMQAGNLKQATSILAEMPDGDRKLIPASWLNTPCDTSVEGQR